MVYLGNGASHRQAETRGIFGDLKNPLPCHHIQKNTAGKKSVCIFEFGGGGGQESIPQECGLTSTSGDMEHVWRP